ncbi:thiamine pyrophosphate-dependent dehydrogenase E1 component subunit alpha [Streptomyces chartreusis]|uniref:thiamine pyrophosphate-dependent dehydrogenase E1 component subunit alpha n=1 Tax=Streptomyces chartreusis TaxID=1969 RepID=UPI0033B91FD3
MTAPADTGAAPVGTGPARLSAADLRMVLLIRRFEEKLLDLFAAGELNGTTHTCLGQEYVPVALTPLLTEDDFVLSNHRGHGHYLARYDDPAGLLAEITGREGAVCGGVGGSQHLYRRGFLSTGVQGESLSVAVGAALHFRRTGRPHLALAYTGDGTWGEGTVYEALNMARLWRVPLVVVVENNGIAQSTRTESQLAGTIAARAAAFACAYHRVDTADTDDIAAVRSRLEPLFARVRGGDGPLVVEFLTHRLGPHSKGDDTRPAEERRRLAAADWCARYARSHPVQFAAADRAARAEVERITADVLGRPRSRGEDVR